MSPVRRSALVASLLITLCALPILAQDRTRSSGTMTLTPAPTDRVQVLTTRRARLGITINLLAAPTDSIGALIVGVTPNGPAARAGLKSGDIVMRFNGKLMTEGDRGDPDQSAPGLRLIKLVAELNPGDSTIVQYRRLKAQHQATVIAGDEPGTSWSYTVTMPVPNGRQVTPFPSGRLPLQTYDYEPKSDSMFFKTDDGLATNEPLITKWRRPMPMAFMMGSPLADLELAPVNPKLGKYFATAQGVLVIDLPDSSLLNLQPGDVVLAVDGRQVQTPNMLLRALMSYEPGESFSFQVVRDKKKQAVVGSIGER